MTTVLILDGQQRSALAAARSLGRRGLTVLVADAQCPTLAGSSRHVRSQLCYPDPRVQPAQFTDWVLETARRQQVDVVLPLTDLSTMLLAPAQDRFGTIRVGCGPAQSYEFVSDKAKLLELARADGICCPATTVVTDIDQLAAQLQDCTFPVVLKPARSKVLLDGEVIPTSVHIAHSAPDALAYARNQRWFGTLPCLVQQFVPGEGAGIFAFFADGQPIAWFAHRRIREKPPSGGVSVLSESAPIDASLQAAAEKLLRAVRWSGAAMVEFKIHPDGTPYLMEINARLWGSLQLAIDSGVDFPWLIVQHAIGGRQEPQRASAPAYSPGRRLRWLLGDLDNLIIQARSRNLSVRGKLACAARFLGAFFDPASRQEIFRWGDTAPAFFELRAWLRALA